MDSIQDLNDFDGERQQIIEDCEDRINKAAQISFTINTEGWELIKSCLSSIEDDALDQLEEQMPGDDKSILAAHSVWYTAKKVHKHVLEAVYRAIQDGEQAKIELQQLRNQNQDEIDLSI